MIIKIAKEEKKFKQFNRLFSFLIKKGKYHKIFKNEFLQHYKSGLESGGVPDLTH